MTEKGSLSLWAPRGTCLCWLAWDDLSRHTLAYNPSQLPVDPGLRPAVLNMASKAPHCLVPPASLVSSLLAPGCCRSALLLLDL